MVQIESCEPEACVVTRAGTKIQPKAKDESSNQLDWESQEAVRKQVLTWIRNKPAPVEPVKSAKQVSFGTMEVQNMGESIPFPEVAQQVPVPSPLQQQSEPDGDANVWEACLRHLFRLSWVNCCGGWCPNFTKLFFLVRGWLHKNHISLIRRLRSLLRI